MSDLRAECLAMAEEMTTLPVFSAQRILSANEIFAILRDWGRAAALLRRVADALEPKSDGVEAVAKAIDPDAAWSAGLELETREEIVRRNSALAEAKHALSAAEPFIQARIREAVEAVEAETARCVRAAREEWADDAPPAIRQQPEEDGE